MAGMDMMLKQLLGIDPAEIKKQFEEATKTLGQTLAHFDARLVALEKQQGETNSLLLRIATSLPKDVGETLPKDVGETLEKDHDDGTGNTAQRCGRDTAQRCG